MFCDLGPMIGQSRSYFKQRFGASYEGVALDRT